MASIRFKGIIFRRYPDAKGWAERSYFTPGIADREKGWLRLHEEIWRAVHGDIPEGHEIHHVDFEPTNNDLANLVCISIDEHKELHRERGQQRGRERGFGEACLAAAAEWHGSDEGRSWHGEHARQVWDGVEHREETCEQCDAKFQTRNLRGHERFCSNNCKSAHRRASGVDNEQRRCALCGTEFTINRYASARTCGRVCAQRLRRGHGAGVQPDGGGSA